MSLHSPMVKLLGVATLALLLIIPLWMVSSLVAERRDRLVSAEASIAESQGRAQTLAPPVLSWTEERTLADEKTYRFANALTARETDIAITLTVQERRRGIFRVPVYVTHATISGRFAPDASQRADARPLPGSLRLLLPVTDLRGVREVERVLINGHAVELEALGERVLDADTLGVPLSQAVTIPEALDFEITLAVTGTRELWFWPLAQDTRVALSGDWPDPSFAGAFLPIDRTVTSTGFSARWSILAINRRIPEVFGEQDAEVIEVDLSRFGLVLHEPVGLYQQNERSLKYGVVFVGLTFALLFLIETLLGRRIHPVQYLLIGAGLVVFYMVLLALSEHIGFLFAYWIAAALLIAIIGGYARSMLGSAARGAAVSGWLAMLYGFLYLMVDSEDYALVIGAVGVLALLAAAMWLTRGIDWYRSGNRDPV